MTCSPEANNTSSSLILKFLLIFLFFSVSKAEIVKDVVIDGNKRVSNETIKIYGKIDVNKDYKDKELDLILKNLYGTDFFEDVKVPKENLLPNKSGLGAPLGCLDSARLIPGL